MPAKWKIMTGATSKGFCDELNEMINGRCQCLHITIPRYMMGFIIIRDTQ